jgi:nucleoside-diphosphate-sugar epimerase
VIWLWAIYCRGGTLRPYNVGSRRAITTSELALAVSRAFDPVLAIDVRQRPTPGALADRYVPDVSRACEELAVTERIPLEDALKRTIAFHRSRAT